MGRLIDIDEVKKRLPIMENDFGMVINKSLHNELDKVPTVEAISKANMMDILNKIRAEIEMYEADCRLQGGTDECEKCNSNVFGSIYRIIDKYKAESEVEE